MSLQFRLNLVIALSMLLIIGMGAIFTIYSARQSVYEEIMSSVTLALQSIDASLSKAEFADDAISDWQSRIGIPEKTRHLTLQLIPLNHQQPLTTDSGQMASHTPISVPAWFVWWVKPEALTAIRTVKTRNSAFQIIIHDNPNDEIIEAWGEARGLLGLIILQSLLIWGLVHMILGRALKSVPVILNGLEQIEAGDYQQRLPDFSLPEFSRISAAFNHAASALEKTHQENRHLTRRSLTVQEQERRRLSQELHDELGQSLTGIKVIATAMIKQNPESQDGINSILTICDHLFSVVRSMMRRLRPTVLDELGLAASLEDMLGHWRTHNPHITVTMRIAPVTESADVSIHLFRIVQESLNNITRHSQATEVSIDLKQSTQSMTLIITDNGHGYDPNQISPGFGLLGIRERAESLGGQFHLHTQIGSGTSIHIEIPCNRTDL